MKKKTKLLISTICGLDITMCIYSLLYFFTTGTITYLFWSSIPLFTFVIGFIIYGMLEELDE